MRRVKSWLVLPSAALLLLLFAHNAGPWCDFMAQTVKRALLQEDVAYVNAVTYGSALTDTTLTAAIAAIGSNKRLLFLPTGAWILTAPVTVPANIRLWIPAGSYIVLQGAGALTLYQDPIADSPNWYTGGQPTIYGRRGLVFGSDYGMLCDGTSDDTTQLNAAIAGTPDGGTLLLPPGACVLSSTIAITRGITIEGQGWTRGAAYSGTTLRVAVSPALTAIPSVSGTTFAVNLRHLALIGTGPGTTFVGMQLGDTNKQITQSAWDHVQLYGFQVGLVLTNAVDNVFSGVTFQNCTSDITFCATCYFNSFYNAKSLFSTGAPAGSLEGIQTNAVTYSGNLIWCSTCTPNTRPCTGGGAGAFAYKTAGGAQYNCP